MKISVIISTYNRGESLKETLISLSKQNYDGNFKYEIIVVDNNSKDNTKKIVEEFAKNDTKIRYVFEPKQGLSNARNIGIKNSKGEIVAFTDDDVIIDKNWLLNLLDCFRSLKCDGIGGRVLPTFPDKTPLWIKKNPVHLAGAVVIYDYGPETKKLDLKSMSPCIGANFAFSRKIFDECGLFRTDLGPPNKTVGDDSEFIERLVSKGKNLYYCGQVIIEHPFDLQRLSLKHMARWHMALGRFDTEREINSKIKLQYYFGVPRYLFKGAILDFFRIPINIFNKLAFMNAWRTFFRKIGMIDKYLYFNHKKQHAQS